MKTSFPATSLFCALAGAAALAAALHLRAAAARDRALAARIRAESAALAPDLDLARRARETVRRLGAAPAPAAAPSDLLAAEGLAAARPAETERPLAGGAPLRLRETALACPAADPAALSRALAAASAEGYRLAAVSLDAAPGGRIRADMRFHSFRPLPLPAPMP